ncbi:hypothetical protein CEUSTIGMA_g9509.t1 [Chlamydomonas eustigma]|uniref:Uncharacterized protein n=1 Tax=Chlamydomonas eustigma TaxID=1157962 RepID=A0A250XG80_9CHLO|nr:hypothetical protein CEUSTIGMA_g9509.t1 [Chlamydomonas eustigma]|eukprot:GAX82081.1 hypothetical protein CEUSTIGMA_g9509.t1 [Chlamydomonas eustigma]
MASPSRSDTDSEATTVPVEDIPTKDLVRMQTHRPLCLVAKCTEDVNFFQTVQLELQRRRHCIEFDPADMIDDAELDEYL